MDGTLDQMASLEEGKKKEYIDRPCLKAEDELGIGVKLTASVCK